MSECQQTITTAGRNCLLPSLALNIPIAAFGEAGRARKHPLISIIIPARNDAKALQRTLNHLQGLAASKQQKSLRHGGTRVRRRMPSAAGGASAKDLSSWAATQLRHPGDWRHRVFRRVKARTFPLRRAESIDLDLAACSASRARRV